MTGEDMESPPALRRLNLGSGSDRRPGHVNADLVAETRPDVVCDLDHVPWPFASDSFDEVVCHDVLEHLEDLVSAMRELHRVCRPGATVQITVPHYSCANSYADPTHRHHLSYRTFDFFTGDWKSAFGGSWFRYRYRYLVFHPTIKNALFRRIANRWPDFWERHFAWIAPAFFLTIRIEALK